MGFTVPPTIKELTKKDNMGQSPTPKPIEELEKKDNMGKITPPKIVFKAEELTENDYRNLFEGCDSVPTQEIPAEATETAQKPFDGFDWDKDMEEAYKTD